MSGAIDYLVRCLRGCSELSVEEEVFLADLPSDLRDMVLHTIVEDDRLAGFALLFEEGCPECDNQKESHEAFLVVIPKKTVQ